ncbi:hypothetical protein LD001_14145 [Pseudomonas kurunegalensis]|uniref:hypothetical protein n=1 Tax=Pseudomonas kurunegalensis TaxID=485880 RepID=UPI001CDB65EC|nr:hypothetical protein [Pseudomonas kurunegalensis]MCA4076445.1 hypothetical protein [Pseudomonas kurunegalensis]
MPGNGYLNPELSRVGRSQAVRAMLIVRRLNVGVAQNALLGVSLLVMRLVTNRAEEPFNDARHAALPSPILIIVKFVARIALVLDHHSFSHEVSPVDFPDTPREKGIEEICRDPLLASVAGLNLVVPPAAGLSACSPAG